MPHPYRGLALFDFDGTITTKDSFLDFIFFCRGIPKTILGILINSPFLVLMIFKIYPRGKTKEKIWNYFFGRWPQEKFTTYAEDFTKKRLPQILRPQAIEKILWHKTQGHKIVVVSASFENYLSFWCKKEGIDLIATQVEIKDGKITGAFASQNCYGQEKVHRIKEKYNLKDFNDIIAYGDSRGDLPFKKIATEFHYKPFR